MTDINLLFLSPNWRVSLIRAFRATMLTHSIKGKLVGADCDPYSPAQVEMDSAHTISRFDSTKCFEEILAICQKEKIDAILPLMNLAVEFLNQHRVAFLRFGVRPVVNESEAVKICHDKLKLAQFCKRKNFLVPELFETFEEELPFPLIAKPRRGEGAKGCMKLEDRSDLNYCRAKFPEHIVQRFVNGREFSVDWYSSLRGTLEFAVPRERLIARAGEVMVSRIELRSSVIDSVTKFGLALGLQGPCTLQGFLDENEKFLLTDVNLRYGSGSIHSITGGADSPLLLMKDLLGEETPTLKPVQEGLVMTRFSDGFYLREG